MCKSSDPAVLPPNAPYGGRCRCESTCFTPRAIEWNTSAFFPWSSPEEQRSYLSYVGNEERAIRHSQKLRQCRQKRRQRASNTTTSAEQVCSSSSNSENFTLPCEIYGAMEWHLYYIPKAKLIFCGVPKVGISEWIKFFRYVYGAKDYLSLPHFKLDRTELVATSLPKSKLEELLKDPTWTKAVFLRNPYDRLLSAYSDKIVKHSYTQSVFGIGDKNLPENERPILNFSDFVDLVTDETAMNDCTDPKGLKPCTDPHWRPQLLTCGLDYVLPHFDFIGNMDHIALHTRLLLERVGLWEEYGQSFDDGQGSLNPSTSVCAVPPPQRASNDTVVGFNQRGASKHGLHAHATGSKSLFDQLYTPDIQAKVRRAYALDFAVWDHLSNREPGDVASGTNVCSSIQESE